MADFKEFARKIAEQYKLMSKTELYVLDMSDTIDDSDPDREKAIKDFVWNQYLDAFPGGTNEIFRKRRYYDGSYDRNFIRKLGHVISIDKGKPVSIWDAAGLEFPFNIVAEKMREVVRNRPISGLFRHYEPKIGYVSTLEMIPDGAVITWHHFHAAIEPAHFLDKSKMGELKSESEASAHVFRRGLNEISSEAIQTVLDLIDSNQLYRGSEFKEQILHFKELKEKYSILLSINANQAERSIFVWSHYKVSGARIRNTLIGTLLVNLSERMELDEAVRAYESMVAPHNYKRTKSIITPRMVEQAMKTIQELNLESALERRHASIRDVSINNVLWVDGTTQKQMKGALESLLLSAAVTPVASTDKAQDIHIDKFLSTVLPNVSSLEVLMQNQLIGNLMSITAPVHDDVARIFKWDNNFAWSYKGDITDSIKERVKKAGGNVNAKLRVSLAWNNADDLDIHAIIQPNNSYSIRTHIYFGNKMGVLDVDMNAHSVVEDPVENLSWLHPTDGRYLIVVHNYRKRTNENSGFTIELESDGILKQYSYSNQVLGNEEIPVIEFVVKDGKVEGNVTLKDNRIQEKGISQEVWNIKTEQFVKVKTLLNSPNYWNENATGNKHWFFILENCLNPEPVRGIYNEFLIGDLTGHRKVFEVLGEKTKCLPTNDQLSGLGFSSTQRANLTVRVKGEKFNNLYNINF